MNTMEKGVYGYGKRKLVRQCILCAACLALVVGALIVGLVLTGTRMNIWTIGAIFTAIPAATFAVNIIARLKGLPLKQADYDRFREASEGLVTACDMIVTANQKLVPIQASVFYEMGIVGYCGSKKTDIKKAERDINGLLKSVGIYSKIQLFTDYEAFLKRVRGIKPAASEEKKEELLEKRGNFLLYSM